MIIIEYLEFGNMYKGLKRSCKNVRWKTSVTQFELNGLKNTAKTLRDIRTGTYKISKYQKFEIYEPKKRHITSTRIKDRQVQRSLCDTSLYNLITKSFIYDNCACQIGKGTTFAINRLKQHLDKFYKQNKSNNGYILKCDVHHFFQNIDHTILKEQLSKKLTDKHILYMIYMIIDSFGDVGIGLGSQVSQLMALNYLDGLDHYIKEKLHIKFYVRYMDDLILVHSDKNYLIYCKNKIEEYLTKLKLELNSKTTIQPLYIGITFLNWKYIVTKSGKILMIQNKQKLTKKRRKLKTMIKLGLSKTVVNQTLKGIVAHLLKGNSYVAIKELNSLCK